jgi:hypothetical protein
MFVFLCAKNFFFMHLDSRCGRQSPRGEERERRERWCVHTDAMHDCLSVCLSVCVCVRARTRAQPSKQQKSVRAKAGAKNARSAFSGKIPELVLSCTRLSMTGFFFCFIGLFTCMFIIEHDKFICLFVFCFIGLFTCIFIYLLHNISMTGLPCLCVHSCEHIMERV